MHGEYLNTLQLDQCHIDHSIHCPTSQYYVSGKRFKIRRNREPLTVKIGVGLRPNL